MKLHRPVKARAVLITMVVLMALLMVPFRLWMMSRASAVNLDRDRASTLEYARWVPEMRGTIQDRQGRILAQTGQLDSKKIRFYPYGESVSTTVGVASPITGEMGIEKFLTHYGLPDEPASRSLESLLLGDELFSIDTIPDAQLSIDAELSQQIYNLFASHNQSGLAVLMTVDGEILSMVSYPNFNPSRLLDPHDITYRQFINTHADAYEKNRCLIPIPIASTAKPFIWLAYAEKFGHFPGAGVVCRGSVVLHDQRIRCHARHYDLGPWWGAGILKSCDVAAALAVDACPDDFLADFFHRFGLADTPILGINAPAGQMQAPLQTDAQKLQIALGSSVAFSPIAVARAYAAIFHRGKLPEARLLNQIGQRAIQPAAAIQVVPAQRADDMASALRAVVTRGTAHNISRTPLAGKTGTITLPGQQENAGFFAWGAPYPNCQVVGLVVLDNEDQQSEETRGFEGHDAAIFAARIYDLYRRTQHKSEQSAGALSALPVLKGA